MNNQNQIHVLSRAVITHNNQILLCKTLDLKISFYFLPGGHVEHGESAKDSLLRELKEETGFDFKIKRFLGCLEYNFEPEHSSICHNHEYNFIFESECDDINSDITIECPEKHIELIWFPISDLSKIDFRAEPLRELVPHWLKSSTSDVFRSMMI